MKIKNAASLTYGLITFSGCFATATIAHYAIDWTFAYLIGLVFALFAWIAVMLAEGD